MFEHLGKRLHVFLDEDGHEIAPRRIFGHGHGGGLASLGQGTGPHDIERRIHLGKPEVDSIPLEGRGGVFGGLLAMPAFEGGIVGTAFKEVSKSFIQVAQGLLCGHTRHLIEPGVFRLLLELGKHGRSLIIVDALLLLIVGVRAQTQCPVVDETRTAKGPSKILLLLVGGIPSVLVSAFLFHALHCSRYVVKYQQFLRLRARSFLPPHLMGRVSTTEFL